MARIPVENDPAMKEKPTIDKTSLGSDQASDHNCFRPISGSTSLSLLPEKFDHSVDPVILRTLSSSPLQSMSRSSSDSLVGCVPVGGSMEDPTFRATESSAIPRRNLTEAFEELYIEPSTAAGDTPVLKQATKKQATASVFSPTGVADFTNELAEESSMEPRSAQTNASTPPSKEESGLPHFSLHEDLKRELSDALVDRVSFYAVIHDINKEASTMASLDDSGYNRNPEDLHEEYDPLVVAVNGHPKEPLISSSSMINAALVDEERWLLDTIDSRVNDESRSINACPPTFLQAIGERDYENPLASLSNGSRTQLWKPSRSWWEAKSGKNPWIEPKSHNKRWRYLWPLIHYHKFLARCIKKLKRNGVDVKTSVSPVAVFLREEVCAVSDHLASISLFDSDRWMECLEHFTGWTDTSPDSEKTLRSLVSQLKLRPLSEPGDVDSPLLRSQIDEQYLRAMASARASARAQMAGNGSENERRTGKDTSNKTTHQTPEVKSKKNGASQHSSGPPPTYPRQNGASSASRGPVVVNGGPSPANLRRPHWGYPPQHPQWYGSWHQHPMYHYGDDHSEQSGISGESFPPQPYDMNMYPGAMHHPQYFQPHPGMYHQPPPMQPGVYNPVMQPDYTPEVYASEHFGRAAWDGQGQGGAIQPEAGAAPTDPGTPSSLAVDGGQMASYPPNTHFGEQPTPQTQLDGEHTPYKYSPASPFWGHLDHTTLAMMGIASPQGMGAPQTPSRTLHSSPEGRGPETVEDANNASVSAQPLLLRQQYPSYGYYGNGEAGYVPPSPATQFMMSPQANFGYGYGAYSGYSPNRTSSPSQSSPLAQKGVGVTTAAAGAKAPSAAATPSKTEAGIQTEAGESAREDSV